MYQLNNEIAKVDQVAKSSGSVFTKVLSQALGLKSRVFSQISAQKLLRLSS